ncbi:MAG: GNAT family N-acetyltransferase, partial [Acidimicrobiales bacterium]
MARTLWRVRAATADDIEACVDIVEETAAEGLWLGAEAPIDRAERAERLRAALDNERGAVLVAEAPDGEIAGHLGLELTPYSVAHFGMCVGRAWRGRRAGSALVEEAVVQARRLGAHKISIQVWPHNQAALGLYTKAGFMREGRLRRHYPRRTGELWDAVIMGLVLDEERPGSPHP